MSKSKSKTTKKPQSGKTASSARTAQNKSMLKEATPVVLPFGRMNYILLVIGIAVIAFGFLLMSLDDFVDATQFSISLYVAPFVVVAGFVEIIYAILYKSPTELEPDADL